MTSPAPRPGEPGTAERSQQDTQGAHDEVRRSVHPALESLEGVMKYPVMSLFLDEGAGLADEQMEHLYEHLRRLGKVERRGLWLHSRGGATEIPWKVISLLREFSQWLGVLVPYRAHSAATHIALGADEIVLTEMSELGPVDPSRRHHPLLPKEPAEPGQKAVPIPISVQDLRHVLEFVKREMGEDLGPDAVVVAQVAVGLAAGLIGAAVMLVIGVTLYDAQMPESPVTALGVFALASSSLLALGFLIASVTRSSRAAQGLGMILFFPMWLLSGAGPPPAVLTEGMRTISKVLPLTYAVSALQDAWLGRKLEPTDVIVLTAILIVAGGLSIRLFRP